MSLRVSQITIICAVISLACRPSIADQKEREVTWDRTPIPVHLSVGEERRIRFPDAVTVGIPKNLEPHLNTQIVNGTIYWRARAPFVKTRVLVRELNDGQTYLLDLQAVTDIGSAQPLSIRRARTLVPDRPATGGDEELSRWAQLTRFAARELHAPLRLLEPVAGTVRIPIGQRPVVLYPGTAVSATPLVAWRSGPLYLTVVQFKNQSAYPVELDPRRLRGQWLAATLQHSRLAANGRSGDSTAVYLISRQPFSESL